MVVATAILNNLAIIPDTFLDDVIDFGEAEEHVIEEIQMLLGILSEIQLLLPILIKHWSYTSNLLS